MVVPLESQEQAAFIAWLRILNVRHHHSPNETGRSPEARRRAGRMKQQGTSPGFPDLVVLISPEQSKDGEGYFLAIEMKRQKGGTVSDVQKAWIEAINGLNDLHVQAYVAKGAEEAKNIVRNYLKPIRADVQF